MMETALPSKIRILITDDHPMMRQTWKFILSSDPRFEVVAICTSGEEAIELTKNLHPDIIIMDINLPGMNGMETTEFIKQEFIATKVIGVSQHCKPAIAQQMIQAGAMGYLTKTSSKDEMFKAIVEVHNGNKYICDEIREVLSEPNDEQN